LPTTIHILISFVHRRTVFVQFAERAKMNWEHLLERAGLLKSPLMDENRL